MNRSRLSAVVVVVLTLAALGVAATTLETTLTTDPDEEINPNWDRLPIDEQQAAALKDEMRDEEPAVDGADPPGDDAETDSSTGGVEPEPSPSGTEPIRLETEGPLTLTEPAPEPPEEDDSLLRSLLPWAVGLLVVVGVIAGVVYRSGIGRPSTIEYGSAVVSPTETTPSTESPVAESEGPPTEWPDCEPASIVDEAWVTMVQQVVDQPATTTPAECIGRAREAGHDSEAVEAIATAFERVHYGGETATEEAARARDGLSRLTGENQ